MSKIENTIQEKSRKIISSVKLEWKKFTPYNNYGVATIKDRWLYLKTQDIVNDLLQIHFFTKKSKITELKKIKVCSQIDKVISILESKKKHSKYMEIVHIITKYLNGIRRYLSNIDMKLFFWYPILFESTMIAITREVNILEDSLA